MRKNSYLVSIITPTYNHENYIKTCIESVLSQTYSNWEQLIIDDGSDDNTPIIIESYKDKRINYIKQENLGIQRLSETYNKALSLSKGEIIAILEGDDYWPDTKIEKQLQFFNNKDVILSWGRGRVVNKDNKSLHDIYPKYFNKYKDIFCNFNPPSALKKLLIENFITPAVTVMIKKEALLEIGGFKQLSYTPFVDYVTWLRLSFLGQFAYCDSISGYWRRHFSQMSSTNLLNMIEAQSKLRMEFLNSMEMKDIIYLGLNEKRIQSESSWNLGRVLLGRKNKKEARREFKIAIYDGIIKTKLKALAGFIFSYLPLNFERFIRILGFDKQ